MRQVGGDSHSSEDCPFKHGTGMNFLRNNNVIEISDDKTPYFI